MTIRENKPAENSKDVQFVAAYLQAHPEFFKQHPSILETLALPHSSGAAVSLIERQLAVLRERNTELRTRLNDLLETSKANDALFDKTRSLVLSLIRADSVDSIVKTLHKSICQDFGIEYYSLLLLDRQVEGAGVRHASLKELEDNFSLLLTSEEPVCGVLRPIQLAFLFGESSHKNVGSAAAVRLVSDTVYGIIALGSSDPHRYHSAMDTLFLRFVADVLNLVLQPKL
ncbi:MAG: DUF484 family protein [Porticoccaceae bacterium]|nr:DUF484 family protein [Porticoccaceae bacterium]